MIDQNPRPAFPGIAKGEMFFGITIREYFAGRALQGLLACPDDGIEADSFAAVQAKLATLAVGYADALIAELAK